MKSLKKLAAVAAVMSAIGSANADVEKVFEPTNRDGAEIKSIELVNGQLLVRCNANAEIGGAATPYIYVGTNTQNFASNAFAQNGLFNVDKYVHAGNGKIYMTEKGNTNDVWTTTVSNKTELNGVSNGVTKVNLEEDAAARGFLAACNDGSIITAKDGNIFALSADGKSVKKNGEMFCFFGGTGLAEAKDPEAMIIVDTNSSIFPEMPYILAKDENDVKRIYTPDQKLDRKEADALSVVDGQVAYQKNDVMVVYNPKEGTSEVNVTETSPLPVGTKSAIVVGNRKYFATAKTIGFKTIGE